ncbi:hypothetical protein CDAR_482031 [Caerostris darwini]|uniref:Uncharacterized protein n=1 Tax=Caerostris darwini TaxID=1538125 RepID=A0AAV4TGT0_9ARAC|nr:hypothetical protein CDAR_482031 [Caerostris darwini]
MWDLVDILISKQKKPSAPEISVCLRCRQGEGKDYDHNRLFHKPPLPPLMLCRPLSSDASIVSKAILQCSKILKPRLHRKLFSHLLLFSFKHLSRSYCLEGT